MLSFLSLKATYNHTATHISRTVFSPISLTHKRKHFFSNGCTGILVMCLWNWVKSKHNNPRKIHGSAPVIPLMTSLMKVTTLQNTGHSLCLYCTEWEWLEETSSTHLCNSSLRRLASWLCGDTHQDWCVFLTMAIYIERCSLAMWGEESLSRTISSRSMVLSPYQASTNYIQRNCPAFRLYGVVPHCITEPAWQQKQGEKDVSLWDDKYCDKA